MNASSRMEREALEKGKKQGRKESIETAVSVMSLCLLDSGLCATSQELYNQYVLWCERNAAAAVAKRTFLQVLSDNQEQLNIKRTNKLQEKGRVRGYYGVQVVDQYPNGGRILIKDRG